VSISCFVGLSDVLLFAIGDGAKVAEVTCCSAVDGKLHYKTDSKITGFKPFTCMWIENNEIYAGS
jgi:hypothetical protein